jgi:predicted transposase YdaD
LSKPFDAAGKGLIDWRPLDWVRFCGLEGRSATVLDSDLNLPITADRLIRVADPDYLLHLELHASRDPSAERRYMTYAVNAEYKYDLPVVTGVLVLRKEANTPTMTGIYASGRITWRYDVYRIWEMSPEDILAAPLAVLPLAPLTNVTENQLPGLIRQMQQQFSRVSVQDQKDLWAWTDILMGLKYQPEQTDQLLRGIYDMLDLRESTSYQRILNEGREEGRELGREEGRAEGERSFLLRGGTRRFGEPDARMRATIEAITSEQELEKLADRLFEVESWDDLLR